MNTITIAREYGSGGRLVGQKLAETLQIPFYDRSLIAIAAKKSGMSEEVFREADEHNASSLLYSLFMGSYGYGAPGMTGSGELPINDKLFLLQSEIIRNAAGQGPIVVVGRCGNYVLRSFPHVFRVFLYADKAFRVERAVHEYGVPEADAASFVAKKDKQRANYHNFYANEKWRDPGNYDLCLNTAAVGIDGAVRLIQDAALMKKG